MLGNGTVARDSLSERWYKGEPIWLTNERKGEGRKSGAMHWPAADAAFPGVPSHPSTFKPYETMEFDLVSWNRDIDALMEWFTREGGGANFVAWYVEDPDHELHEHGFNSKELMDSLKALDQSFAHLITRVRKLGLQDRLNIIFTADHGHVQIAKYEQLICISEYVNVSANGVRTGEHMLYIKDASLAEHYYSLLEAAVKKHGLGMKVYRKADFPDRYGYKNTPRVGDIILLPDRGWSVSFACTNTSMDEQFKKNPTSYSKATHGQDPDMWEMRAVLAMSGPAFQSGLDIEEIPSNVDLYPLMCHVLEVTCAPNNGSLSLIGRALRGRSSGLSSVIGQPLDYVRDEHGNLLTFRLLVVVCSVVAPVALFILYAYFSLRRPSSQRSSVSTQGYSRLKNASSVSDSATLRSLPVAKASLIGDADSMSEDDL
uniref:AP3A hydrolase n=1 Tax=Plectus sambesii TaxID=2011161 RepID=A0A914W2E0_9BILA